MKWKVSINGDGGRSTLLANEAVTEIICHAVGAAWAISGVRTIIDIGGQDSKIIRVNARGEVIEFKMNEKCAAGTGRFIEVMAKVLDLEIEEFSQIGLGCEKPASEGNERVAIRRTSQ